MRRYTFSSTQGLLKILRGHRHQLLKILGRVGACAAERDAKIMREKQEKKAAAAAEKAAKK